MMKRPLSFTRLLMLTLLAMACSVAGIRAQTPAMAYQGYLTDTDNNPLGGTVNLAFALYPTPSGSTPLWEETQTNVQLDGGIFSVMLGSVETLADVSFGRPLYLGVRVNGGSELTPRKALASTPASLFAHEVADGIAVRSINGLTDNVTLQAGNNITLTEDAGTLRIDAEAIEPLVLPFEGSSNAVTPAFSITSTAGTGIAAESEGTTPAFIANNRGTGTAASFAQLNAVSQDNALDAVSFGTGSTGVFSHFGPQGYAGIFRTPNSQNAFPALVAGKQDLEINSADFFNDGLIVRGDAPILGIYGSFQQNTRPGLVLAGVNGDGDVVDKWGIVRRFFSGNGLEFTYGLDPDPAQNATVMALSVGGAQAGVFTATRELGANGTPTPGAHVRDNVVYAWAHVNADGSVASSYGCNVSRRTGSGSYRVTFRRPLPGGVSATVTPAGLNDVVLASVSTTANFADVSTRTFNGTTFVFFDSGFYIQVVGRP